MKKSIVFLFSMLLLATVSCTVSEHSEEFNNLPKGAQNFINEHFQGRYCVGVNVDSQEGSVFYEAKLTDKTKITFDNLGLWKTVSMSKKQLPQTFAPMGIFTYIASNYGSNYGQKIERVGSNFEVTLNNNVVLIFDILGRYAGKK